MSGVDSLTELEIVHTDSAEADFEETLANWLAEGLNKPGKLNSELAKLLNVGPSEVSKMKANKRKILAYQLFTIANYIQEPIPVPSKTFFGLQSAAIPVMGEAGRSAWYENDPQPTPGVNLPYMPGEAFPRAARYATLVVGEDVNTVIPDGAYAIYVPYDHVRKNVTDRDFVLLKQIHKTGGLHKRLIRQIRVSPTRQEFCGASHDPRVNAMATIRLADDLRHVHGSNETIELVGLVIGQGRSIET